MSISSRIENLADRVNDHIQDKSDYEMMVDDIKQDPSAIREYGDLLSRNPDMIKKALLVNGECLYYLNKRFRLDPEMVMAASKTNPEWITVIDPRALSTLKWISLIHNMRKNARDIKKRLGETEYDVSHKQIKAAVGEYLKTAKANYKDLAELYSKVKKEVELREKIDKTTASSENKITKAREAIKQAELDYVQTQNDIDSMQAEYEVIKQDNVEIIKEEERIARANAMVPLEKNYLTDYQKYTEDNMFNEEMKEKEDEFEDDYNEYDLEDTKEDLNDDSFYDFDSDSGFDNPISKIKGKFNNKDLSYTKSFKDKIKDGADVMSNALDGLKSGLSTAKDSMANSIDKIKTKISNKDTGFMKGLKDKTVEGANTLTDAMKGVKNKVVQAKDYVEDSLGLGV